MFCSSYTEFCSSDQLMCYETQTCVPHSQVCDGHQDCKYGTDELGTNCGAVGESLCMLYSVDA